MKKFNNHIGKKIDRPDEHTNPFIPFFLKLETSSEFPFALALKTLEQLETNTHNQDEFLEYLMEDIIFTSVQATFYEHLFITINENDHLTSELIDQFAETGQEREAIIAAQAQLHLSYILNFGQCDGCEACGNHEDVNDLIHSYEQKDLCFFVNLYLGMQTITFALEQLLYDILPHRGDLTPLLLSDTILEYRQYLMEYTEKKLQSI